MDLFSLSTRMGYLSFLQDVWLAGLLTVSLAFEEITSDIGIESDRHGDRQLPELPSSRTS